MRYMTLLLLLSAPGALLADEMSGEQVYHKVCATCHATGDKGSPKFADGKAWRKLIREGAQELIAEALIGVRQMPPKGGEPSLSDREVGRATVFMANAAGGKFVEPTTEQMAAIRVKADKRAAKRKAKQ